MIGRILEVVLSSKILSTEWFYKHTFTVKPIKILMGSIH